MFIRCLLLPLIALLIVGCDSHPQSQVQAQTSSSGGNLLETQGDRLAKINTLSGAIAELKDEMSDSSDGDPNKAAVKLAVWGAHKLQWSQFSTIEGTKFSLVQKDSMSVKGHKICVSGGVIEIAVDRSLGVPLYTGGIMSEFHIYRFIAVGSTGEIVARSHAKFCGVVIGNINYKNSIGGMAHGVQLVGMFDLPENRQQ